MNNILAKLFFVTLTLPGIFIIPVGSTYLYGFYITGVLLIVAQVFYRTRWPTLLLMTAVYMIFCAAINFSSTQISVLIFYLFILVLMACFSREGHSSKTLSRIVMYFFYGYVFVLFLSIFIDLIGAQSLLPNFVYVLDQHGRGYRFNAFATESSYAALLLLVFYRFLYRYNGSSLNLSLLCLTIGAIFITKSIYGVIAMILILAMHVDNVKASMKLPLLFASGAIIIGLIASSPYFIERLVSLQNSNEVEEMGTAGIRLLPVVFFFEQLQNKPLWMLLFGNGVGSMNLTFYEEVGKNFTENEGFSTYMIGFIYDNGIIPLALILKYAMPKNKKQKLLYFAIFILISTNSGFGTYLFLTFIILERASVSFENNINKVNIRA